MKSDYIREMTEAATKKVLRSLKGKTETGKTPDVVETEPEQANQLKGQLR